MFSIMTIASSTTNPTEIVKASSEMLSRLKPARYITAKVASSDNGTARLGITVAHSVRRNRKMTMTTRQIVSSIVSCTSRTAARVTCVRSSIRSTWTAGGIDCSSFGIKALIVSTNATVLAPGAFWIAIPSAGLLLKKAPTRTFCTESSALPTSLMRTGAPLR